MKNPLRLALLFAALAAAPALADNYTLDPAHSFAVFKIQHAGAGNTWGRFNGPAGTLTLDDDATKDALAITLKVDDIDTGNKQRDEHLKTSDFFNAAQFPTIKFVSKSFKKDGDAWQVTGDLTIKGVTKSITVKLEKVGEAKDAKGVTHVGFETSFSIKRADFGVDGLPGAVGDEAHLTISIEAGKS